MVQNCVYLFLANKLSVIVVENAAANHLPVNEEYTLSVIAKGIKNILSSLTW